MAAPILSDVLAYDASSKTGLRWKVSLSNRAASGAEAGGFSRCGSNNYYVVRINKVLYYAHRIVWALCHGEGIPDGMDIDHIDGDGQNNRISNLRVVTRAINLRNQKTNKQNKTGVTGVCRSSRPHDEAFIAYFNDLDGKSRHKHFSINKYGEQEAFDLAVEWRKQGIEDVNLRGAGYTQRHLSGG